MTIIKERYALQDELGRGGMGVVYSGRDTLLKRDVAVKVLSKTGLGTEGSARLLHEAQATAQLNHPNIVTIYDAGVEESHPFIVMELVEGSSLHEQRPETTAKIVEVSIQISAALEQAHAAGIVHRDLKPENVLIANDGTVKLVDFGLARSVATRLTTEGAIVGTVFYMAPELALGREFDGRADLYALGVMLYELTTGQLPYIADDPVAVITQHLHAPLVPPQALNPNIPASLEALIVKLLSKDPEDRLKSAALVREALELMSSSTETAPTKDLSLLDRIVRGRIIGREQELGQARNLWQKAVNGQGQMLLVSGEPGIGKSRLIKEIVTEVEVTGGLALVGECWAEGSIPYSPFAQVLGLTFQNGYSAELAIPDFVMADVLNLAPSLKPYYPDVTPNPPLDPKAEQYRLFENLVTFCNSLTSLSPAALILEDVHWADGGTLALLRHLARRTRNIQLMIVATYREVELDEHLPFYDVLQELNRERLATRIKLSRFSLQDTEQLLGTLFAEDITPEFLEGIYRETEGNPFFVEEVCKALVDSGELYFQDGRWQRPSMEEMRIPQSVRVAIQSRVSKLSESCQSTLLNAAILGREFDFETLIHMAGGDEEDQIDALEEAIAAQLVEELQTTGSERFMFAHALVPTVLREGLSGLRRARYHRKAAAAIEAVRPEDYEALAYQYSEARDEKQALRCFILAGERARHVFANEDAIKFLSEALAIVDPDSPQRLDLLSSRASVFGLLAQRDEQLSDVEEMLSLVTKMEEWKKQAEVLLALADYHHEGDHISVHEPANKVLDMAREHGDIVFEAQALRRLGRANRERLNLLTSRKELERSAELFKEAELPGEAANTLYILSRVYDLQDDIEAAKQTANEAITLSQQAGNRGIEGSSKRILGIIQYRQFEIEDARASAEAALALHKDIGDRAEECNDLNVLGLIESHAGKPARSEKLFRQALSIGQALGLSTIIQFVSWNLVLDVYRPTGEYEAALSFLDKLIKDTLYLEHAFLTGALHWNRAEILAFLGQYQESLESMNRCREMAKQTEATSVVIASTLRMACYYAYIGENAAAEEHLRLADSLIDEAGLREQIPAGWQVDISRCIYLLDDQNNILQELSKLEDSSKQLDTGTSLDDLADALTLLAQIRFRLYETLGVKEYIEEALKYSHRAIDVSGRDIIASEIEKYNFTHYKCLAAQGNQTDAGPYLKKAYERVMLVAGNILDPTLRKSYLENVAISKEILEEAERRGIAE